MNSARQTAVPAIVCLVVLWALIYVSGLFTPALLDDADSVHAEAAREMVERGDWVTLHANGIRYLEKAPLMYWAVAASFQLFGVGEWQARLPIALGALALMLLTWRVGRRVYGDSGGFAAALVMATAVGPYLFTRFLIPDLLVGLWLLLTFAFFLRALQEDPPSRTACWGMAAASALNVLTKGLIGLVFPAAVIATYLLITGDTRRLLKLRLLSSSLVWLAIAAPWHLMAALRNPAQGEVRGFFWFYFVNEHFLRYLNKRVPRDYDTVPLLLFWGLVLVWLLPWSAFLPQTAAEFWRALKRAPIFARASARELSARGRAHLVFGLWALVILVFFSFSTRQEYYVVPAIPALALLAGGWLGQSGEAGTVPASDRVSSLVLLLVATAVCVACLGLAISAAPPPPGADIADLLRKNPDKYALSFGHFFDLTPEALGAFRAPLVSTGIAFLLGSAMNWWLRRRNRAAAANVALAAMMVVLLNAAHRGLVIFSPTLTSRPLAQAIAARLQPGDLIVIDGDYEEGSTLNFYTRHPVRVLNHREANLWYGSHFPDAPRVFETNESFLKLWEGPGRVYLWSQVSEPGLLRGLPAHEVARSGGKYILTNQPLR
ncbi:MAG TPA: glycosyltransferase family 39 protein [Terriglobales bacterium]|nr:glycosyltransferase family 39 protein [Terriglobales bacterium]